MKSVTLRFCATTTTWPFVLSLVVLLLNDSWLKAAQPGLLTGKLSDFSGIAVLTLLLLAAQPQRPWAIYLGLAAAFGWWKSPLSQPAIEAFNAVSPMAIGRTVDYTDLLALLIMPLCKPVAMDSQRYTFPWPGLRRAMMVPIAGATLFALMATSRVMPMQQYTVRPLDPTAELPPPAVAAAIAEVAKRHELTCPAYDASLPKNYCLGSLHLVYAFKAANTIEFQVTGTGGGGSLFGPSETQRMNNFRDDLKRTLSVRFKGLEYVEKL